MTDEEKVYYEEWKKKCAETKARTKREIVEANVKAEAKALADALDAGPGYRRIKSGPKKGTVVWKGSEQQRLDDMVLARENRRLASIAREERVAKLKADSAALAISLESVAKPEKPSKRKDAIEIILAYIFVCAITITYVMIAKAIAQFGFLGLAIFIDFILYSIKARKPYRSRYVPFLWWFLFHRK
jgi:hypothetical protein